MTKNLYPEYLKKMFKSIIRRKTQKKVFIELNQPLIQMDTHKCAYN